MSNSPILLIALLVSFCSNAPFWIKQCIALRLLLHFSFTYICSFMKSSTRTLWYGQYARGLSIPHNTAWEVRTLLTVRHPELIALYASALNHVLGQLLGLPGSHVLPPYVLLHWLRWHTENYCDCVPVLPDEHLSRESWKLTVMMRRELVAVREVSNP